MSTAEDWERRVSLPAKPECVLTQQWAVYESDEGPAVTRFVGADGCTYEDRQGFWYRVE